MLLLLDNPFLRLIVDLLNYFVLISIFFYIYKKKIISHRELMIYSVFCATPFFVNEGLISYTTFWDQQRYVKLSDEVRQAWISGSLLVESNEKLKMIVSSYVVAMFPIVSFSSINSVAFANKGFYCLTLIYLNRKNKMNGLLFFILLFTPTILLYSSVSLRDTFILSLMLMSVFLFLSEKKYITGLFVLIILFIIKPQNGLICFASISMYLIFNNLLKKNVYLFLVLIIFSFSFIFIFFDNTFFEKLNFYRQGFYVEQYGAYKDITSLEYYEKNLTLGFNNYSLKVLLLSLVNFFLAPLFSIENSLHFISSVESLLFVVYLFIFFYYNLQKNSEITFFWLVLFIISCGIYSLIAFNDNTVVRYRFPIYSFFLYSCFFTVKFKSR